MHLYVKDDVIINDRYDEGFSDFKQSLDSHKRAVFDKVIKEHFEEGEADVRHCLGDFISYYLEELYPTDLIYVEYDEGTYTVKGWVFNSGEITKSIKDSLNMPQEDLPTLINSKDLIKKTIVDWRLKNG